MSINYIFRYHGESEKIYSESKNSFENLIIEKLKPLEEQHKVIIHKIFLTFDYDKGHEAKYTLEVTVDSSVVDYKHVESDKDPQVMVHKSIDELMRYIRKIKDKLS
jgi:ribosome-associated translation inhibitor RaiA